MNVNTGQQFVLVLSWREFCKIGLSAKISLLAKTQNNTEKTQIK